jgi:hypothetical protein
VLRSFDATRSRPAPTGYEGFDLDGAPVAGRFTERTLVVAAKPDCLGCHSAVASARDAFGAIKVVIVASEHPHEDFWRDSEHEVVISPSLLTALDVRWPPFYVVIDPASESVVREGVVFGPSQVAAEIADLLV